jgi:hypothetical protein
MIDHAEECDAMSLNPLASQFDHNVVYEDVLHEQVYWLQVCLSLINLWRS